MDLPPGTGVTAHATPAQAAILRRAWLEVATTVAPQLTDLPALLEARLSELETSARLDEQSLLGVAEDASQYALEHGAGDIARALSKRLRRAIYEFLLALDAVNPAELDPTDTSTTLAPVAPAPGPTPRPPVAIAPVDVSGGDEPAAASAAEGETVAEAPAVPLWEQVSAPTSPREVYRVASREVTPVADAAPTAEETEAEAAPVEVGPDAVADAEIEGSALEAAGLEDGTGSVLDAGVIPIHEDLPEDDDPSAAMQPEVVERAEAQPFATELAELAELAAAEPPADQLPEPAVEDVPAEPPAPLPESTWAPVVDVPAPPAGEEGAGPEGPANGVKPPRDLLRVPRQFRRLPPLPGRHAVHPDDEIVLPAEPAPGWVTPPAESPVDAASAAAPAASAPEPVADQAAPDDDDALGVPALPWPAEARAETPTADAAPAPAEEPEAEEDLGLPFSPFALPDEPAARGVVEEAPAAATLAAPSAEAPADPIFVDPPGSDAAADADLPKPPPLFETPLHDSGGVATPLPPGPPLEYPAPPPIAAAPGQQPWPAPAAPAASGTPAPFPIAPIEGFHLTDPGALDAALGNAPAPAAPGAENPFTSAIPPVNVPPQVYVAPSPTPAPSAPAAPTPAAPAGATPAAPAPAASVAPPPPGADQHDEGTWRIRQSPRAQLLAERMAQKRREEAARAAFEAASVNEDKHGRKRRKDEDALPDLVSARRQLDEHLRKKRGAEAGALLQRLAQGLGGREIADLALDAGDRCRALGQSRSATNCYLAAWRADPLYETPLWRLSDVCLNEQEIDLAVGYLERIADLMRSRGDDDGAIGVYRKIAMIAPERQDVRDVIRLAKTTGRLDV